MKFALRIFLILPILSTIQEMRGGEPQNIDFPVIPDQLTSGGPITLSATASSGLPVSFEIVSLDPIANLSGNTLTLTGNAGSVTVKASQAGDGSFDPAVDVFRSFLVGETSHRFTTIASGHSSNSSFGIRADGTLWAWGRNDSGQLGDNSRVDKPDPVQVGTSASWAQVASGFSHTIAIRTDGTLWAWGNNRYGKLGDGSNIGERTTPTQIGAGTNWIRVAAGFNHSLAVRGDGTLWAWGNNTFGQLGISGSSSSRTPVQVGIDDDWETVACGINHTVAIKKNGTLWAWGENDSGQLGTGDQSNRYAPTQIATATIWIAIACGQEHTVAISANGNLWAWGSNTSGQLGNNTTTSSTLPALIDNGTQWVAVAGGGRFTIAIDRDGSVYSWGQNFYGNLGDGSASMKLTPVRIDDSLERVSVACGSYHALAIASDGSMETWGSNFYGQLGLGIRARTPAPLQADDSWTWDSVAFGHSHALAIGRDGKLWAWGENTYGKLGDGSMLTKPFPTTIAPLTRWTSVDCGISHSAGIQTDGTLWTWGGNNYGQLGHSDLASRSSPQQIGNETNWSSVSCGREHTAAIRSDGTLWTWGRNTHGQLGDGTTSDRYLPTRIGEGTAWASVVCGEFHTAALRTDGTLWTWGSNDQGQLGTGDNSDQLVPSQIGTSNGWAFVASSKRHNLAIRDDGTLWAWGENVGGKLGDGTSVNRAVPVPVGGSQKWLSVTCGYEHSVAIREDGTLWTWGGNQFGQLGPNGGPYLETSPLRIGNGTEWKKLPTKLSDRHSGALTGDGALWTWGATDHGLLGRINPYVPNPCWPAPDAQSLSWEDLPAMVIGERSHLDAVSDSGLPVTYSVSGPAVIDGSSVIPIGPGNVTVTAYQAGGNGWMPTDPVSKSSLVSPKIIDLGNGSSVCSLSLPSGVSHFFDLSVDSSRLLSISTTGIETIRAFLHYEDGRVVSLFNGPDRLHTRKPLHPGVYILELSRRGDSGETLDYELTIDTGEEAVTRPDVAMGVSTGPPIGKGVFLPDEQTAIIQSRNARPSVCLMTVENLGNAPDSLVIRATKGNGFFSVAYFDSEGNATASLIAGNYVSEELDQNDTELSFRVAVSPNKRKLVKKTSKRVTVLRKTVSLPASARSTFDPSISDSAAIRINVK